MGHKKNFIENLLSTHKTKGNVLEFGYGALQVPLTAQLYTEWLSKDYYGEMTYLKESEHLKMNPKILKPDLKSVFVFLFPYTPHPEGPAPFTEARIALYAQGKDYHFWIKDRLRKMITDLKAEFPNEEFYEFTDSAPILERDLAARFNLGWFGKNTCLLNRSHGSLFLIGEIFSTLSLDDEVKDKEPSSSARSLSDIKDFCGTCTKCLEICPTKALEAPRVLNAKKCISYWTIESRQIPPESLRKNFGDHFFGCDLCQTVCPWTQKNSTKKNLLTELLVDKNPSQESLLINELHFILTASGKALEKKILGTPLKRAGPFGLRRNAMIVIANRKLTQLRPEVEAYLQDLKLCELARWTLAQLEQEI